jgi:3-phenylpropionate/trans-cinnamate dioxygenase ferredoxin reductase subunit
VNIVVIGAGLAGANAVQELRDQNYTGDLILIGEEPHLPYERPPPSKGLLLGTQDLQSIFVHDHQWYADQQVDLRLCTSVTELDLDRGHVHADGHQISFDRLLLATGAQPRRLPILDSSDIPVVYLRTLDDSNDLKYQLSGHVLIIGAGWIGLEVASAARQAGATVTVLENAALPLLGVLGPKLAPVVADLHREHGVDLRLNTSIAALTGSEIVLSDGHRLAPDVIVVGIGAVPDTRLAARAGLVTGDGVLVNARLRASDPHVYAAGDVANHDHPDLGRIRVEHWDNAIQQGKHAARVMLGSDDPYTRQPYFFTDQYDLGMEYVGHAGPRDELVIRGNLEQRVVTAFWIRSDTVVAGMHINDWDAIEPIKRLVGRPATPRLRNPNTELAAV